ncbi:MAG TPA: glycosyltransferase, partial [Thermoanaerobaculia bacterium]|nr:glycosyltransferase [Thermoanaerobaculia bacterium]
MISIIVVSWNSGTDLEACVESLAEARRAAAVPAELIVVDNGSQTPPGAAVRRRWPDAIVAELGENAGFGPAVNAGAARAGGDILLLVNPDAHAVGDV